MADPISTAEIPSYDVSIWKTDVFDYTTIEAFLADKLPSSGIIRIGDGLGKVEFKLENAGPGSLPEADFFLVGFSGAMTNRSAIAAPLFSGINLSRSLKMPLLAFADPVVSASRAVTLAWYAGGEGGFDHPRNVARVIDYVSNVTGRIPVLIGGSGGGFATISTMRYMAMPARGLVWNPQTQIAEYNADIVQKYIDVAISNAKQNDSLRDILVAAGVDQDVCSASYKAPSCLVYLQNDSDHHVGKHMEPFLARCGLWHDYDHLTKISHDRRIIVRTGNWGSGHAVPPNALVKAMVALLTQDSGQRDPLDFVPNALQGILESTIKLEPDPDYDLRARAIFKDGRVHVTVDVDRSPEGLSYAYYMMEDGARVAVNWYSSQANTTFLTEIENPARLSVVVFARHAQNAPNIHVVKVESADLV
ncbi:hypothetical protein [Shinella pollutisoli]|uniref:Uncharacterized protein n=1 Tax=Shinella pollutisoli TaxID=2250594 RepID=A0ABV7DFB9_9HYPH|nr:hypothetical protein [Shinella pollutisoli]